MENPVPLPMLSDPSRKAADRGVARGARHSLGSVALVLLPRPEKQLIGEGASRGVGRGDTDRD